VWSRLAALFTVFGKASFTIEMLCRGSIEVSKVNPEKDIFEIVDYMFQYY
jgi:hypothetical protein